MNHLLTQNGRALTRLARFAGKTARFDIAPFSFAYTILEDGTLCRAVTDATADAVCVIAPSLLPRLALHDEKAQAEIGTEGDAALLTEIFSLSHSLHWNAAQDLGRVTGDAAAERIMKTVQDGRQQLQDMLRNAAQTAAGYWTDEPPLLAKPQQVAAFVQQVDALRDDVARLEQRIKRLPAERDN